MSQQSAIQTRLLAITRATYRGVALASSLAMLAPAAGAHNRLGIGTGSYGNANAISLNYTRQTGNLDFGAAAAWAGGDTLAKASLGVSW